MLHISLIIVDIMSSNIKIERVCDYCGNTFIAKTTRTRYCSHQCNSRDYKKKAKNKKISKSNSETAHRKLSQVKGKDASSKEVFNVTDAARFMSVSRVTIYSLLKEGKIKGKRISDRKVLILKSNLISYLEDCDDYYHPATREEVISESYTYKDIIEKYKVSLSWIYIIVERSGIKKTKRSGIIYLPKEDVDNYFVNYNREIKNITEWYSMDEVVEKYGMTRDAIDGKCKTYNVPKKKDGRFVKISKKHFDQIFNI